MPFAVWKLPEHLPHYCCKKENGISGILMIYINHEFHHLHYSHLLGNYTIKASENTEDFNFILTLYLITPIRPTAHLDYKQWLVLGKCGKESYHFGNQLAAQENIPWIFHISLSENTFIMLCLSKMHKIKHNGVFICPHVPS
jgi:hypothetical protein